MKKYLLLLSALCVLTYISRAQIKRVVPANPSIVKTPAGVRTPQNLVYIVMSDGEGNAERKAAGQLTKQTPDELGMIDFFKWRPWVFKKDAKGTFSYTGPKDEPGELVGVYLVKPQGPITSPSAQNMNAMDYAAICLSDGKIIYARISGKFSAPKGYSGPAGGGYVYLQAEKQVGGYDGIKLHWDPASQKWVAIPAHTFQQDLKTGKQILAVYSYYDMSSPFYKKP